MFLSADVANLLFYCAQQLGVTLGVGAETIMLAAYLIATRDGVVDSKETQYARAIRRTMVVALVLILISGLGISMLHAAAGHIATVFTPAYLFKILLICLVAILTMVRRSLPQNSIVEGFIGGTWFALFVVHILAPVTGWLNLFTLYAIWLVGFILCWEILVVVRKEKKPSAPNKKVKEAPPETPQVIKEVKTAPAVVQQVPPEPIAQPMPQVPAPTVVLAPDLPPAPAQSIPPPPAPAAPIAVPAPKLEEITLTKPTSLEEIEPSPKGKVTDTPFLPKVPALQPIPTIPGTPPVHVVTPTMPQAAPASPASAPVTTMPGGTSGLGITVMPKSPDQLNK